MHDVAIAYHNHIKSPSANHSTCSHSSTGNGSSDISVPQKLHITPFCTLAGSPPDLTNRIKGDAFAPRNPYALNIDFELEPPMFDVGGQHRVASWLCDPRAPKVELPKDLQEKLVKMKKEAGLA